MRVALYVFLLLGLLGYGALTLYRAPGQVSARVESALARVLASPVVLQGCEEPIWGTFRAQRVEVAARPRIESAILLGAEGVQFAPRLERRGFQLSEGRLLSEQLEIQHASISLERDCEGGGACRWNFAEALQPGAMRRLEELEQGLWAEFLDLSLRSREPGGERLEWAASLRSAELRPLPGEGWVFEAEVQEGALWSDGRVEAAWTPSVGLSVSLQLGELRSAERLVPLLDSRLRAIWFALQPRGVWDLVIEKLGFDPDGRRSLRARLVHYDTTAILGGASFELRHLAGPMLLDDSALTFGDPAGGQPLVGELAGSTWEISGSLGEKGTELVLRLERSPLADVLQAASASARDVIAPVLEAASPAGTVTGELRVTIAPGGRPQQQGRFRLEDVLLTRLPLLDGLQGELVVESPAPLLPQMEGEGRISPARLALRGVGDLSGEVRVQWDQQKVQLECTDLKLRGGPRAGGTAGNPASATNASGAPNEADVPAVGCVLASVVWDRSLGPVKGEVRWLELPLETGLLSASGMEGDWKEGEGHVRLRGVSLPAGLLDGRPGELLFAEGDMSVSSRPGFARQVELTSLILEGAGGSLRARGTVDWDGACNLVLLWTANASRLSIRNLPRTARPDEWCAAAGEGARAFRVEGTLEAPVVREVGPRDPSFVPPG